MIKMVVARKPMVKIKAVAKKVGKAAAITAISASALYNAAKVGSILPKAMVKSTLKSELNSKEFRHEFSNAKVLGGSILVDRTQINNMISRLNQKSKPNVIFFFDGKEVNKINLPKYAMTANNALQILPEQSQIRIQSMLEKMIFEKNTRSAILNDPKEMLDFKDILENANYNKLERKLGKKNAMLLQNTIKKEISKLPKEKQAYLIKKLDIIKQTNWTLGIVAQLQLLFLSGYIFAFVKR